MQNQLLPANWQLANLGDISSDISYGYTASATSEPTGVRLLRITDIQNNTVNWPNVPNCKIEPEKVGKYRLKPRDLVFARTGATVGKSYLLKGKIPESVYASYLIRVRCLEGISIEFLSNYFQSPYYWRQITDFSAGIGQPNVNGTKLKNLSMPVPPLAEQKVIADKLDTLLAQVENTKARLERIPQILKRFRQSVLAAAVSGRLTEEWRNGAEFEVESGALGNFVSIDIGHAFKSKEFTDQGVSLLRGQNIEPGALRWSETKYFPEAKLSEFRHLFINADDIVLAMDRPIISSGLKVARAKSSDLPCVLVQRVARFRSFNDLLPDYLYALLQDISFTNYIQPNQTGSDIPHISGKQILAYPVAIPNIEEQTEIVRRVDQLFAHADRIEQQVNNALARVNNLTQSILAKAFRGKLTEQWRRDNPELISGENSAEALLERIRAERAAVKPAQGLRRKANV
jgi:type I restriction enzyme S subunit